MVSAQYAWIPITCERYVHLGHKELCLDLRQPNATDPGDSFTPVPIVVTDFVKVVDVIQINKLQ